MRNYFKALQLAVTSSDQIIIAQLQPGSNGKASLEPEHREDACNVLLNDERRLLYKNTVKLYENLHLASGCLCNSTGIDTHRWGARLANFDTADSEL